MDTEGYLSSKTLWLKSKDDIDSKNRACEKKSVNSVFYDYIFTYPAL